MERGASLEVETPERVTVRLELAGVGARCLAWLADAGCIFLLWVTGLLVYSAAGDLVRDVQTLSWLGQLAAVLSAFLAGWGWDVAWEVLGGGRTPGKRMAGLRVLRTDGGPVSLSGSLVRNALRAVELPFAYAPAILAVALSPRRQRLGDLVGGTLVVRERRFDLSRYQAARDGSVAGRFPQLRRTQAVLGGETFERLADYLRRRPELAPAVRASLAQRLAAALATRAGVLPPPAEEAEPFLEALREREAEGTG
jgi:uncharacterized RDD family membrane protein YckC